MYFIVVELIADILTLQDIQMAGYSKYLALKNILFVLNIMATVHVMEIGLGQMKMIMKVCQK